MFPTIHVSQDLTAVLPVQGRQRRRLIVHEQSASAQDAAKDGAHRASEDDDEHLMI
jgi:hypothetical protein